MIVCMPIGENGQIGDGWGRAHDVAVARIGADGEMLDWTEFPVHWDTLHDQGGEGQHHARIARFLMDHGVERVISGHMGPGMVHMLEKMNISTVLDVRGDARDIARQYGGS
jgi:predicted Fe-Mo cluster-binding NifX family protein